ncbi:S8 family peptidase [Brevundimonas sp. SL130]|uniref:S8 family peptidase n=1 Tax=Brevundimonas sp. SL130 TaxID=2995143 RepID=UPI00226CF45E|nr:S8 family peptidase [Brevundimonas sp. SL130]WAC60012.1 S8 family serine peptidase [Brevundimonas sp. SL130]
MTSSEYLRNYGLANMKASVAWQAGATGNGVTVAVVDSGVSNSQADLVGRISSASTDVVAGRNTPYVADDSHGTLVSGVIASNFNGLGSIGVAYESTILSIRTDISECDDEDDDVCFSGSDLVRALDFAVANGVKIINMSLGGDGRLGSAFEAALLRAVNSGAVIVASSGNDGEANPGWPAQYAVDPRFAGAVIAVGSHGETNLMSDFSNRAGVTAAGYISAPGEDVITGCDGTSCWRINGTSFSAPHVSGALALLMDAFPNLTAREALAIVIDTARDAGDAGTDIVYGRGLLDLANAFRPVGATSVPMADGASIVAETEPGSFVGPAFGDAFARQTALGTVLFDGYDRMFAVQLGGAYPTAPSRSYQAAPFEPSRTATTSLALPNGGRLNLTAAQPVEGPEPIAPRHDLTDAPWLGDEPRQEAMLDLEMGRLSFATWQGRGGASSPFDGAAGDGFAALAQVDHAMRGAVRFGALTLAAESGGGDRRMPLRQVEEEASSYSRATLAWRGADGGLSLSLGALDERLGPLGAFLPGGSDFALPSRTSFYAVGGDWSLRPGLALIGEAGLGATESEGRFLSTDQAAISSNWRLGLLTGCVVLCDRISFTVSQPLRIERGTFSAWLADVPVEYFDPLTYSRRSFSATPSGRQIDFILGGERRMWDGSSLSVQAVASREPRHVADAAPEFALIGGWRRQF